MATKTRAELIRPIIPIDQWLTDYFYVGPEVDYMRPYVTEFIKDFSDLKRNVNNKRKFICTGASRTGKSYGTRILLQRILYEMSCYRNFPCLFLSF